jgi:polyhydroxybutyrate depolymerase
VLHVPADLPEDGAALIVDLHGFGSNPDTHNEASRMRALADEEGFVVAQPAARGELATWNPQPGEPGSAADVQFIRALVVDVAGRVPVDRNAVFASGFSNGGGMAHRLACDAADVFAAVGTVSGQYPPQDSCDPAQPVAIVSFHGTTDVIVPYRGLGRLLPDIPIWAGEWAERLECSPVPSRERIADDVIVDRWTGCSGGTEVLFHTIEGGAHSWPGSVGDGFFAPNQTVDASQVVWEFFAEHHR